MSPFFPLSRKCLKIKNFEILGAPPLPQTHFLLALVAVNHKSPAPDDFIRPRATGTEQKKKT